jgi:hypothetical protein
MSSLGPLPFTTPHLLALGAAGGLAFLIWGTEFGRSLLGNRSGYEEHSYTVLESDEDFEVRAYAPALVARTVVPPGPRRPENNAFRRLAGYIFGRNKASVSIAMTVPVIQEPESVPIAMTVPVTGRVTEKGYRMHFVLPSKWTLETLPTPLDPEVELSEIPARTFAVKRFSGIAYAEDLASHLPSLRSWMAHRGLDPTGEPRMAFYDPPWTLPFLRRNEVLVPIDDL